MILALSAILALGAVLAFGMAVYSAMRLALLVPPGQRLKSWFALGWWQFDRVVDAAGAGSHTHVRRYIIAVAGFLACVIGGIALGVVVSADRINGTALSENASQRLPILAAMLPFLHSPLRQES